jgi:hypothetical protein
LHNQFTWNFGAILVFESSAGCVNIRHFEQNAASLFPNWDPLALSPNKRVNQSLGGVAVRRIRAARREGKVNWTPAFLGMMQCRGAQTARIVLNRNLTKVFIEADRPDSIDLADPSDDSNKAAADSTVVREVHFEKNHA